MAAWWYLTLGIGAVAAVATHGAARWLRTERRAVDEAAGRTRDAAERVARPPTR